MPHELNDFCERVCATVRARNILEVRGARWMSQRGSKDLETVLAQELSLLVVHRVRGELTS